MKQKTHKKNKKGEKETQTKDGTNGQKKLSNWKGSESRDKRALGSFYQKLEGRQKKMGKKFVWKPKSRAFVRLFEKRFSRTEDQKSRKGKRKNTHSCLTHTHLSGFKLLENVSQQFEEPKNSTRAKCCLKISLFCWGFFLSFLAFWLFVFVFLSLPIGGTFLFFAIWVCYFFSTSLFFVLRNKKKSNDHTQKTKCLGLLEKSSRILKRNQKSRRYKLITRSSPSVSVLPLKSFSRFLCLLRKQKVESWVLHGLKISLNTNFDWGTKKVGRRKAQPEYWVCFCISRKFLRFEDQKKSQAVSYLGGCVFCDFENFSKKKKKEKKVAKFQKT